MQRRCGQTDRLNAVVDSKRRLHLAIWPYGLQTVAAQLDSLWACGPDAFVIHVGIGPEDLASTVPLSN